MRRREGGKGRERERAQMRVAVLKAAICEMMSIKEIIKQPLKVK